MIRPFLKDADYVSDFAADSHIVKSIIYVFHAIGAQDTDPWPRARLLSKY